jgi:hypothetical protein
MDSKLEKLTIPTGFRVVKNDFTTYNPETEYSEEKSLYHLTEDLLQLEFESSNLIVDLGWYGNFETNEGDFIINVIRNQDWENPLRIENDKSQKIITIKL